MKSLTTLTDTYKIMTWIDKDITTAGTYKHILRKKLSELRIRI